MKDIAIYGAGGFGREVYCLINSINNDNRWNFIGFFDDGKEKGSSNEYGSILGGMDDLNQWSTPLDIVIAIGNPNTVEFIATSISNTLISFPNIIANDVALLDKRNFVIGRGNIICNKCWISCNVRFGDFNILNVNTSIGHDVKIGNYNSMMPSVCISGEVSMNDSNFFGVASVVLQRVRIGLNVRLGANSVLINKPKNNNTYIGNPAVIL